MQNRIVATAKVMQSFNAVRRTVEHELSQGISPRRLALTLALGVAIGCIPLVGVPTLICVGVALALRLNVPAIQLANYTVMPLQLLLIVPFMRLGGRLLARPMVAPHAPLTALAHFGAMAGQALVAWALIAAPVVVVLTLTLPAVLRRIPMVAAAEAGEAGA